MLPNVAYDMNKIWLCMYGSECLFYHYIAHNIYGIDLKLSVQPNASWFITSFIECYYAGDAV